MTNDPRLAAGGLGDLCRRLAEAYPDEESIWATAQRLNLESSLHGRAVEHRWQSMVVAADDVPGLLDRLLKEVMHARPEGSSTRRIAAWLERGARTRDVEEALRNAQTYARDLASLLDPRTGRTFIEALRSCLLQVVEFLQERDGLPLDLQTDADRIEVAARAAATATKRLRLSLDLADRALTRVSGASTAATLFEAENTIAGQLMEAAGAVDQMVAELIRLTGTRALDVKRTRTPD